MTQNDLWELNYISLLNFIKEQKKLPSKHRVEEHQMLNWFKYQKKRLASGQMKPDRTVRFKHLLKVASQHLRKNQYAYIHTDKQADGFCGDFFQ